MKAFRQLCPACKQTLELPISANGKLAQCPACETTFTAGEKPSQTTVDPASPVELADENASVDTVGKEKETEKKNHFEPTNPQDASEPSERCEPAQSSARTLNAESAHATAPASNNPISSGLANPANAGLAKPLHQPISGTPNDSVPPLSAAEDPATSQTDTHVNSATPVEGTAQSEAAHDEESVAKTANQPPSQLYSEDRNPFSQPLLQKAVVTEPSSFFVNSNEISNKHITAQTQITIVSCSTAELFKTTWAIMLDRGLLLAASLLFLISIVGFTLVSGTVAAWILSLLISDAVMFILYCSAITLISTLTTISLCRNAIGIVRKTPQLVADSTVTLRALINSLVPVSLIAAVAIYFKWQLLPLYTIDITVIAVVGLCTIGTLGWFWSSIFLCSDMQCSGFKSLVTATRIFYRNKVSTLALVSTCTISLLISIVSWGILLIIALPFIQLLLATSYLMMTNQPFANPRYLIATDENT